MTAWEITNKVRLGKWPEAATLAGSFGYVAGPVLIAVALWLGLGWRGPLALLALAALPLTVAASRLPHVGSPDGRTLRESFAHALFSLRRRALLGPRSQASIAFIRPT